MNIVIDGALEATLLASFNGVDIIDGVLEVTMESPSTTRDQPVLVGQYQVQNVLYH